jgi:hypothetical protein
MHHLLNSLRIITRRVVLRCIESDRVGSTFLKASCADGVEVLGLGADDGFVDFELVRAAFDGEVGELLRSEDPVVVVSGG